MTIHTGMLPTSVQVGPHVYTIRSDDDTVRMLRNDQCAGDSRPDELLIRIDPTRPASAVAETLLHELMHCVWHQAGLTLDHEDAAEERTITSLAPLLLHALRANDQLVAFLVG